MPTNGPMVWLSNIWMWLTDLISGRARGSAENDKRTARQERIEAYHNEDPPETFNSPLFARRGLFASAD